ncbi:hypothetical protein WJX72_001884 [[Myrmecia] bisecta]|uniref:Increased DNA methylation 1 C-terminal domain-containing protein n=1 Tax=[Myrmecia] bisecta TaxID=41462 RepID=A0AAW1PP98_9CHLO
MCAASDHYLTVLQECEQLRTRLLELQGQRRPLTGDDSESYTVQLVRYIEGDRASRSTVEAALRVFKSSFAPMIAENGRDMIEMVCKGYWTDGDPCEIGSEEDEDKEPYVCNYEAFYVMVLRKGPTIVTAATIRFWGCSFAEIPFVATKDGYRHDGNCTRLVQAIEELLTSLKVRYMVVASLKEALPMWRNKFHCLPVSVAEVHALEERIVTPDFSSCQLLKKLVYRDPVEIAAEAAAQEAARAAKQQAEAQRAKRAASEKASAASDGAVSQSAASNKGNVSCNGPGDQATASAPTAGADAGRLSASSDAAAMEVDAAPADATPAKPKRKRPPRPRASTARTAGAAGVAGAAGAPTPTPKQKGPSRQQHAASVLSRSWIWEPPWQVR